MLLDIFQNFFSAQYIPKIYLYLSYQQIDFKFVSYLNFHLHYLFILIQNICNFIQIFIFYYLIFCLHILLNQIQNLVQQSVYFQTKSLIYNNFKSMAEHPQEQLTQYQKFRLQKVANKNDDDNFSAHFSNFSVNMSFLAKSQRQININSFRSSNQNEQDFVYFKNELSSKNHQLQKIKNEYIELQQKYAELFKNYKIKSDQAQKYKKLYNQQLNRQKQTKQKLKNWVKQAKTNLNR